ncbi:MAG TPA: hypothetical protein VF017_18155 [Thermoanaerobaculia bacterium]|nr:hypothetical protein [Thermoanaerobaculia bacterium]
MIKRTKLSLALLLTFVCAGSSNADCPPGWRTVMIEPGHASVAISKQSLVGPGSTDKVIAWGAPLHGTLGAGPEVLTYTPNDDFWTVGNDSFTVSLGPLVPGSSPPVVEIVRLVAMIEPLVLPEYSHDFEGPLPTPWHLECQGTSCGVEAGGALTASQGLRVSPDPVAPSYVEREDQTSGGSNTGGAGNNYRPPPINGGGIACEIDCPPDGYVVRILALGSDPEPSYALETRQQAGVNEMRILEKKSGLGRRSTWVTIPETTQNLRLLVWNDDEMTGRIGGAMLLVDREAKSSLSTLNDSPAISRIPMQVGLLDPVAGTGSFSFDDIFAFKATIAGQQCRLTDDFESGAVDGGWTTTYGAGALVVDPEAKGAGSVLGLLVNMVDTGGTFGGQLGASLDPARHRWGARFRLDPTNLTMPGGGSTLLAEWRTASGQRAARLTLVQNGSDLRLRVYARQDDGTVISPTAMTLSRAPHTIEIDWLRSPTDAADASTGYVRVWVDGVRRFTVPGLANDGQQVNEVRIGAASASASGRVFLDQIELWDSP